MHEFKHVERQQWQEWQQSEWRPHDERQRTDSELGWRIIKRH